jgi:hypothetical protein
MPRCSLSVNEKDEDFQKYWQFWNEMPAPAIQKVTQLFWWTAKHIVYKMEICSLSLLFNSTLNC